MSRPRKSRPSSLFALGIDGEVYAFLPVDQASLALAEHRDVVCAVRLTALEAGITKTALLHAARDAAETILATLGRKIH